MTNAAVDAPQLVWWPQDGPQAALFRCPHKDILFGGSRGGGKTDGIVGRLGFRAQTYGKQFNAIIFRQTMPATDDLWDRAAQIYWELGAECQDYSKTIRFREGGRLRLRPLERVSDADKYQGQNLTDIVIEEAGLYASPDAIDRLWGAVRTAGGVPVSLILTGNPGGAGQHWIRERYIDPWPAGNRVISFQLPNGAWHSRIFIPSKIQDNKILLDKDPHYVNRLYMVGSPKLVRAWLDGDWSAVEGAYFDNWRPKKHIMRPFPIPKEWTRYCSMDWGSAKPFSVGWWAIVPDDDVYDGHTLPRGCAIRYREWYGRGHKYNEGLKYTVEQVAKGIKEREAGETFKMRVADPSIFRTDGGPSHAERFSRCGVHFAPGDNTRLPERGRMVGWDLVRARLDGQAGLPMMVVFDTCIDLIRTLPVVQHDQARPEDLDTDSEDHALDEVRYFCASRPFIPQPAKELIQRRPKDGYAKPKERSWREY